MKWSISDIASLTGKIAIVTGASSGLGLETTRVLALKGATVILAVRNVEKGKKVVERLLENQPEATLKVMKMDLSSLTSVKTFTQNFKNEYNRLDILINNAGLVVQKNPDLLTKNGFGLLMGVNHLGHFALTGLLIDLLLKTPQSRIVTVTSLIYKGASLDLTSFHTNTKKMYGPSKLANILFTLELQRKLSINNSSSISLAAHPGATRTDGVKNALKKSSNPLFKLFMGFFSKNIMQSTEQGALNLLRAATDLTAKGGQLYGPDGFRSIKGSPTSMPVEKNANDEILARKLWERSIELTGVTYDSLSNTRV